MDRKGKDHIKATLPFLHIYCCNTMPASFEGNSGALNNRVTMLYFKPGYLNGSSGVVEYADHIWADDAGGVLEAAREGLIDLMASGFRYHESSVTKEAVKEWQMMTDPVSSYFEDIRKSEWACPGLEEDTDFQKGNTFYKDFKNWCLESGKRPMGKKKFYQQLTRKLALPYKPRSRGGERWDFRSVIKIEAVDDELVKSELKKENRNAKNENATRNTTVLSY
jgi:phage/plasmid-associated DNA primase